MTFDKPEHKELCLQLINNATFSGQLLDIVYEFRNAVLEAAEPEVNETPK